MPNDSPSLVIDAKFPLEAWNALRDAADATAATEAARQFRRDMEVHIKAIAEKYLIAGETQDTAFMFVPSESIFADIHENHEAVIQRAHKARVVIVSPSLLMLSIQVVQALLKDARMREQAHLIQGEVLRLMEDVSRLDDRVRKLQTHFGQAQKDIDDILVSSGKVTRRGQKIEALEFEAESGSTPPTPEPAPKKAGKSAESATGQLRLRVVDGDGDGSDQGKSSGAVSTTASSAAITARRMRETSSSLKCADVISGRAGLAAVQPATSKVPGCGFMVQRQ